VSAIYGDQLAFFPELLEEYTVFKMKPGMSAFYGERYNERTVTAYFSYIRGGNMGIEGENRVENQNATMWIEDESGGTGIVKEGDYVEVEGSIFLFNHDDGFSREGSFLVYTLQLVTAFTDKQVRDEEVNLGASDFN